VKYEMTAPVTMIPKKISAVDLFMAGGGPLNSRTPLM